MIHLLKSKLLAKRSKRLDVGDWFLRINLLEEDIDRSGKDQLI